MTTPTTTPADTITQTFTLHSLSDTQRFAQALSAMIIPGDQVYLEGDLGAGKTTLIRETLQAMGVTGSIKSPTYSLIEPYTIPDTSANDDSVELTLLHCDLYRLSEPEELEYLGVRDLFYEHSIALIEWPKRGAGYLPEPTIHIKLQHLLADLDASETTRELTLTTTKNRTIIF